MSNEGPVMPLDERMKQNAEDKRRVLKCASCGRSVANETRYRLHFEPVGFKSVLGDRFFCCVPCVRNWATKVAEVAE